MEQIEKEISDITSDGYCRLMAALGRDAFISEKESRERILKFKSKKFFCQLLLKERQSCRLEYRRRKIIRDTINMKRYPDYFYALEDCFQFDAQFLKESLTDRYNKLTCEEIKTWMGYLFREPSNPNYD